MFNSTVLDVAAGMVLVYLLLSLMCTAINEAIAAWLGSRGRFLKEGIESLFTDGMLEEKKITDAAGNVSIQGKSLANAVYEHGLVQGLYKSTGKVQLPSYIPSKVFSGALLDILLSRPASPPAGVQVAAQGYSPLDGLVQTVNALPDSKGKEAILALVKRANGDLGKTQEALEEWYEGGMDRVAGWYKRKTQGVLFGIGLFLALLLNADSVHFARAFWSSPQLRSYAVKLGEQYVADDTKQSVNKTGKTEAPPAATDTTPGTAPPQTQAAPTPSSTGDAGATPRAAPGSATPGSNPTTQSGSVSLSAAQKARDDFDSLKLPVGWNASQLPWCDESNSFSLLALIAAIVGWLTTALAMTLGAPFWFDLLSQIMNIRSSLKPDKTAT